METRYITFASFSFWKKNDPQSVVLVNRDKIKCLETESMERNLISNIENSNFKKRFGKKTEKDIN